MGWWCAVAMLGSLAACGGGDDDEADKDDPVPAAAAQALEGIYEVSSFTRNEAGCVEGPSVLQTLRDHNFVVFSQLILGIQVLNVTSCTDEAKCRTVVQQAQANGIYSYEYSVMLSASESDGSLTGFEAGTGTTSQEHPNMCTDRRYVAHRLTSEADGTVHVESRTTALADAPQEDGFCWAEPKKEKAEAAGRPCTGLVSFEGTRVSAL